MPNQPPEPAHRSDGELLRLYLTSHDQISLTEIITRHAALVRGVCQRLLGNTPDAEDAFQATFLVLVRRGDRIHQPQSLAAWLYGVAHRIAQRLRRQRSRAVVRVQEEHLMIDTDALAELATRHDVALFDAELARLPEKYRSPIVLHHLEGKTQREIATELKLTEGAVDGLLKRGRNELRVRLARRGVVFGMTVAVLEQSQQAIAATPSPSLIDATVHSILSFDPVLNHEIPRSPSARLAQQEITTMGIYHAGKITGWVVAASLLLGTAGVGISSIRHDLPLGPPALIASELDALEAPADAGIVLASATVVDSKDESGKTGTISGDGKSGTVSAYGSVTMSGNTLTTELPSSTVQYRRMSANEKRLYQALHDKTEVSFVDSTLRDAMDFIEDRHRIEIFINQQEIAEEGLSLDTQVTLELSGAELHNVLDLMLEPHNLDYVVKNEVLMITTREKARSPKYQELRIYNIDELPPLIDKAHRDKDDANQKIETAIKDAVGGEGEWTSEGGTSTLQWTPAGLIVRTNQRMHAEIEEFLQQLRRADGQEE
ncbi:MAG: sigma-70 family RNA polymerase sigma factor [Planctomycetaceae bacterium]